MELLLANHSSYPRIGDDPDGQLLRRTITLWEKGEKTDADLHSAEDRQTERALAEQVQAGLDLVTDGQIRWYDPISHLAGKLEGVRINGLLRFFDTNFYFRQPVVASKPARAKPLVIEEHAFAQSRSPRPVKVVLTGPYTLARLSLAEINGPGAFDTMLAGYVTALAQEVQDLAAAGAQVIQIDEPTLLRHPQDFPLVESSLVTLAKHKGPTQLGLAVYFGDPAPLYEKLTHLPVEILGLDFTYSPALVDRVAQTPAKQILALGFLDGRNTKLEDANQVARQLDLITRHRQPPQMHLTTSCGLEYLPRDRAQLKLKHLTAIKKVFLGEMA